MNNFSSAVTVGRPREIFLLLFDAFFFVGFLAAFFGGDLAGFFLGMMRPYQINAAATAFDKCTSRQGARARSAVVKSMQKPPVAGSIHSRFPVEPVWPNACRPSRSQSEPLVPGAFSFQPNPHGAVRRIASGSSGKSSSRFVVIIWHVAGESSRTPLNSPAFRTIWQITAKSSGVLNMAPHGAPSSRQYLL